MDPNVKDKILSRPRAKELARWEPLEPSIQEMRRKLGGPGVSDEEMLLRWLLSKDEIEAMQAASPPKEYISTRRPVLTLIEELTRREDVSHIRIQNPGLLLTIEKKRGVSKGRSIGDR